MAYKFGGLRFDGTTEESGGSSPTSNPRPWAEKSVRVSAFVYEGSPLLSETSTTLQTDPGCTTLPCDVVPIDTTVSQNDPFRIYGGDAIWNFNDLMVDVGFSERTDRRPFLGNPDDTDVKTKNRYVEVDWVAYPWLIPAARWESFDVGGDKTERISMTVNALIRANIKGFLAADQIKTSGTSFETEEVVGGVVLGF